LVTFHALFDTKSQKVLNYTRDISNENIWNIDFAAMDYRANEIPELYTRTYPVIHLYKHKDKTFKQYEGDPENQEHFEIFLSIHSTKIPGREKKEKVERQKDHQKQKEERSESFKKVLDQKGESVEIIEL